MGAPITVRQAQNENLWDVFFISIDHIRNDLKD